MYHRTARLVALAAALMTGSACTQWQVQHVSPEQGFAREAPDAVDLTLTDGQRVLLYNPVLRDSIIEGTDPRDRRPRRVLTSRVAAWSARQPDANEEGVAAALAGLALGAIWAATWDPWGN